MINLQKQSRLELPKYIKWIRTLECVVCGEPGHDNNQIVPHHIKGVGHLSGGGLKAGDEWAMPMHKLCHDRFHIEALKYGYMIVHGKVDVADQWEWVARTLARAVQEGVLK